MLEQPSGRSERCCNETWESAYERFETPEQEVAKFVRRLIGTGAKAWPRDAAIVELFCGRGGGLRALTQLGFTQVEGVDLSASLLAGYVGPARLHLADCRQLPFDDASRDVLIVQGGLHHLPAIPDDLDLVLSEVRRVLRTGGRFVVVEPWLTPFLRGIHMLCDTPAARWVSPKLDALAVMVENERSTYEQWLRQPSVILASLGRMFTKESQAIGWGKLVWTGIKNDPA